MKEASRTRNGPGPTSKPIVNEEEGGHVSDSGCKAKFEQERKQRQL